MTDPKQKRVISLAQEAKGAKITRADLAYELKELGVKEDSIEVSKLVWDVYAAASDTVAALIASTYVSNTSPTSIIDEYASKHFLNGNDHTSALSQIDKNTRIADKSLKELTAFLSDSPVKSSSKNENVGLLLSGISKITGASGVQNVKKEATAVVQGYTNMVNVYEEAKSQVKDVMNDFVDIRCDVLKNYDKYVLMLTDFFGDSIKSVAPVLFDFDNVEYLNTQEMLKNVMLKYDKLTEDCSTLVGEISEGFSNSLQQAARASKGVSKGFGLAIAVTFALSHYLDAGEKTAQMKMELGKLKLNIKHDVVAIKGDYARLASIYKTINDLYIPKANAYYKYSDKVLGLEFQKMLDALYANANVKDLVDKRSELLDRKKEISDMIADHNDNISYYEENIKHCREIKEARQNDYDNAIAQRPEKPSFIVNIFTLGQAKKKYNRHVYDWNSSYGKVVREYDNLDISIKADTAELEDHKNDLNLLNGELKSLNGEIKAQTAQIMSSIKVEPEMKRQLAEHLESIIKLLYIAKDIAQSGLEERQIKAVKMDEYKDNELPEEIKSSIHSFTSALSNVVAENADIIAGNVAKEITDAKTEKLIAEKVRRDSLKKANGEQFQQNNDEAAKQEIPQAEMPDAETMVAMTNGTMMVAQSGFKLMGTLAEMQALHEKNKITSEEYDKKLQEFKSQFQQDMQHIDDKSKVLKEILAKINTADDEDGLKNALLLLADGTDIFKSDKDIEDFLQGNKTINI